MSATNTSPDPDRGSSGIDDPDESGTSGLISYTFDVRETSDQGRLHRWTATEYRTGKEQSSPSMVLSVLLLLIFLFFGSDSEPDTSREAGVRAWREATADPKQRFDEHDVTEDDVEDAIEWARSQ